LCISKNNSKEGSKACPRSAQYYEKEDKIKDILDVSAPS